MHTYEDPHDAHAGIDADKAREAEAVLPPLARAVLPRLARAVEMMTQSVQPHKKRTFCSADLVSVGADDRPEGIAPLLSLMPAPPGHTLYCVVDTPDIKHSDLNPDYLPLDPQGRPTRPFDAGLPPEPLLQLAEVYAGLGDLPAALALAEQLTGQRFAWRAVLNLNYKRHDDPMVVEQLSVTWRHGAVLGVMTTSNNLFLDDRYLQSLKGAAWPREVFA